MPTSCSWLRLTTTFYKQASIMWMLMNSVMGCSLYLRCTSTSQLSSTARMCQLISGCFQKQLGLIRWFGRRLPRYFMIYCRYSLYSFLSLSTGYSSIEQFSVAPSCFSAVSCVPGGIFSCYFCDAEHFEWRVRWPCFTNFISTIYNRQINQQQSINQRYFHHPTLSPSPHPPSTPIRIYQPINPAEGASYNDYLWVLGTLLVGLDTHGIIIERKRMFSKQYTTVEVIKQHKSKKTSIAVNSKGKYFISKHISINNAQIQDEIQLIKTIKHPNIVDIHQIIADEDGVYVVEQYCEEGDLGYHMLRRKRHRKRYYMEDTIANWVLQVLLGLEYLHSRGIIHKNIRPQNIFLTSQGNIKIGSLRFSKPVQKHSGLGLAFNLLTAPYNSAPQYIQQGESSQKVDIWAVGCLIQQLCTLKSNNLIDNAKRISKGKYEPLPFLYSAELNSICSSCLQQNPENRPTTKQLLANPYFLSQMKGFIKAEDKEQKQGINQFEQKQVKRKIPIKKYNIHKVNQEKNKIEELKLFKLQKKQSSEKINSFLTKKSSLEQNGSKLTSKQDHPYSINIREIQDPETQGKKIERKSSVENRKDREKLPEIKGHITRSHSKEITKRSSLNKNQKEKDQGKYLPAIEVNHQLETQSVKSGSPSMQIGSKQSIESPVKKAMSSRPPRRKSFGLNGDNKPTKIINVEQIKMMNDDKVWSKSEVKQPKKLQQEVKTAVSKVLESLEAPKMEPQQQLSFELQDEEDIRLTTSKDEQKEIIDAYKTKLNEIIQWMMCKYSPSMETIMERTMEMDSNTFANLKL